MKFSSILLIFSIVLTLKSSTLAQSQPSFSYKAEMIVKKMDSFDKKPVLISQENGILFINGVKNPSIAKTFRNSSIQTADYSYSEKPLIKEAIGVSLALGLMTGLPFFFTKTKKHWLALSTENDFVLLELQKDNYRRLLFEMDSSGIKVLDIGDRDSKPLQKPQPDLNFISGESCSEDSFY